MLRDLARLAPANRGISEVARDVSNMFPIRRTVLQFHQNPRKGEKTLDTLMRDVAACSAHLHTKGSPTGFLTAAEEGQTQSGGQ